MLTVSYFLIQGEDGPLKANAGHVLFTYAILIKVGYFTIKKTTVSIKPTDIFSLFSDI